MGSPRWCRPGKQGAMRFFTDAGGATAPGLLARLGMAAACPVVAPRLATAGLITSGLVHYLAVFLFASAAAGFGRRHYATLVGSLFRARTAVYVVPICAAWVLTLFWSFQ